MVGWGIIGIGNHADNRMAPAIGRAQGAELRGVFSRDQERADAFAAKHGASRAWSDLDAMLADPGIEIVYIGSPHPVHAEHAIAAVRAGKHVLCDKPMATTLEQCEAMIAASATAGRMLAVGFNQRYSPPHRRLQEFVASGRAGDLVLARTEVSAFASPARADSWRGVGTASGGSLLNTAPHSLDLLRYVTGQDVVEVAALADDPEREELTVAGLRLTGGVMATLISSRRMPFRKSAISLHGSQGYLATEGTITYDVSGMVTIETKDGVEVEAFGPPAPGVDQFTLEIEQLSRAVRGEDNPLATGRDGLENLRTILALQESTRTGRAVRIEPS
jgi:1,5-anhydro-D-fructose reductase (1,5-anhydro-D-mannitol-forming)